MRVYESSTTLTDAPVAASYAKFTSLFVRVMFFIILRYKDFVAFKWSISGERCFDVRCVKGNRP